MPLESQALWGNLFSLKWVSILLPLSTFWVSFLFFLYTQRSFSLLLCACWILEGVLCSPGFSMYIFSFFSGSCSTNSSGFCVLIFSALPDLGKSIRHRPPAPRTSPVGWNLDSQDGEVDRLTCFLLSWEHCSSLVNAHGFGELPSYVLRPYFPDFLCFSC